MFTNHVTDKGLISKIYQQLMLPGLPWQLMVKRQPAMRETWVQSLGWEDPLENEMATHSSTLAWKIPWTEEPGRLQSMGSQRVRHTEQLHLVLHAAQYKKNK